MKTLMIMNNHSYPGREYLSALKLNGIGVDVAIIGNFDEVDSMEDERCGNLWNPVKQEVLGQTFNFHRFSSLKDPDFLEFLKNENFDIAIQGGTGILRDNVINSFKFGILNFHPGDLPEYRGCSAPEWQLYEGRLLICTCHLVDKGIDTGKVLTRKILNADYRSYEHYRASVYPETAKFVVEVLQMVHSNKELIHQAYVQNEDNAQYRNYIGDEAIQGLKELLKYGKDHIA